MNKINITQKRIFELMKVNDQNKGRLFKRLKETGAAPICKRCGGSGRFSYNYIDGSTCYGCGGAGIIIDSEANLLIIIESKEIQDRLNTYLEEHEVKRDIKTSQTNTHDVNNESNTYLATEMFQNALERYDWEFAVRIMVTQKAQGISIVDSNKATATNKQISLIKSLIKKKKVRQQRDKDNLIKLIEECENGTQTLNHTEVQYIINWLNEKL